MASPTFAEVWTQWKNLILILQELDLFGNNDANNWVGMEDTLMQSLEGDYVNELLPILARSRGQLSSVLTPANLQAMFLPFLKELARVIGVPERDPAGIMSELRDYMVTNSQDVNSRGFSFGTASAAGGNTGNYTIIRCTVDQDDMPIEGKSIETITAKCVRDQNSGAQEHQEVFEFRGLEAEKDFLYVVGSGKLAEIRASDALETEALLQNPSFSADTATATPTSITGWTVDSAIGNFQISTAQTYRDFVGDSGPNSLLFEASDGIGQIIKDTKNARLSPLVPYWMQVAVFPTTGITAGTITLRMGATSRAVTLTSLNLNAWNVVRIIATPDKTLWLKNFGEADLDIKVEIASLAGGSGVYIDDILFVPFKRFDNHWFVVVPNAASNTAALRDDSYTFADTLGGADGVVQKWIWRAGLGYVPSIADTTETITDPS